MESRSAQISALTDVGGIRDLTDLPFVSRELMIIKVSPLLSHGGSPCSDFAHRLMS